MAALMTYIYIVKGWSALPLLNQKFGVSEGFGTLASAHALHPPTTLCLSILCRSPEMQSLISRVGKCGV